MVTLAWGTILLNTFPGNKSYWNKPSKGYKSPPKLHKHHSFMSPVTHFHSQTRTNIQYPFRTGRAGAEGLYLTVRLPPDLFKHLTCMTPMVNWTRQPWEMLEHHRMPWLGQPKAEERWKSSLSSRQSTMLNQMFMVKLPLWRGPNHWRHFENKIHQFILARLALTSETAILYSD